MMDIKTFETFQEFSVTVPAASLEKLQHLTPEEEALYSHLVVHSKRLEQERIGQDYANRMFDNLVMQTSVEK